LQKSEEMKAHCSGVVFIWILNYFWFTLNLPSMFYTTHTIRFLHILATDIHTIITDLQLIMLSCFVYTVNHFTGLSLYFTKKTVCACNETNVTHYLSSVYWVTKPLHVSGFLVAHHQEVAMYICDNWYVLYILVHCR
jgi:hypothetical protein